MRNGGFLLKVFHVCAKRPNYPHHYSTAKLVVCGVENLTPLFYFILLTVFIRKKCI